MKTVCQNTDKTINNNCLVSEDKTPTAGGGPSDPDKPPVQSRTKGAEVVFGAGGPSVNSPRHRGVSDSHTDKIHQFDNIQGQLEVQTPSHLSSFFFVKFSFEMIIFEGCQEKVGGSIKIKRAAEDC